MIIKTRCIPTDLDQIFTYIMFVSDILHMKHLEYDLDGDVEEFLEEDDVFKIVKKDGHGYILLGDNIYGINDASEAVCVYYDIAVQLYHYCEELDEYNFTFSVFTKYECVARGIMDEDEWSDLNANAFAYLCIENFFGELFVSESTDSIAKRADEMRDKFGKFVFDAYFKSFSDIIERIGR